MKEYFSYDPVEGVIIWKKNISRKVRAGDVAGTNIKNGGRQIRFKGKAYKEGRLCWYLYYQVWPKGPNGS